MTLKKEYRPIVLVDGRQVPYHQTYPKPDINWASYFTRLHPNDVVRWEEREVITTPWKPLKTDN